MAFFKFNVDSSTKVINSDFICQIMGNTHEQVISLNNGEIFTTNLSPDWTEQFSRLDSFKKIALVLKTGEEQYGLVNTKNVVQVKIHDSNTDIIFSSSAYSQISGIPPTMICELFGIVDL